MSNRGVHQMAGMVAGGVAAFAMSDGWNLRNALIEVAGGVLSGCLGGMMPDVLEPASTPNHRGIAHGVFVPAFAIGAAMSQTKAWRSFLRERAEDQARLAARSVENKDKCMHILSSAALRFAAGAIPGLLAGYASHLILDARTSKGLPLIG